MLRSIQVLRGVAATAVVVFHAYHYGDSDSAARLAAAGVDLFFVISGFIMATVATDREPGRFLVDRIWRIFPLWFIALVPWLIVRENPWGTLLSSYTLWPVWDGAFHMPALYVGWTLCFEMLFYAAFALALAMRPALPLGLYAAAFLTAPFLHNVLISYIGSPMILEFLAGVAIAQLPPSEGFAMPLLLAGVAWFALAPVHYSTIIYGNAAFARVASWGVPAALIVYSVRSLERRFGRFFDLPVLLGAASYAIYLFHPLLVGISGGFLQGLCLSLAAGLLIHLTIERPLIALRHSSRQRLVPQTSG